MTSEPILRIKRLSKAFGKKRVLQDISLDVCRGEILGIIGASGSGKSTLLKTMVGFYHPDSGDVIFKVSKDGQFQSVYKRQKLAKKVFGFASQEPSFYDKMTVLENIRYFGALHEISGKPLSMNCEMLLSLMDLQSSQRTLAGKLSGGMERRLDIACSLIHDPSILVLDEPTADLDPALRQHIWNLVRKINRKGTTVILASHHLSEVETFCSRIAIIKEGRLMDCDTPLRLKTKHAESEEIIIQSYPGNYVNIAAALKSLGNKIGEVRVRGSELVIFSSHPNFVLHELLHTLETLGEELIDIHVARPGLDELFSKMTAGKVRLTDGGNSQ